MKRFLQALTISVLFLNVCAHASVGVVVGDAYVNSANPTANFGSATVLNVGGTNTALVQFDLSRLTSQLLSSANTPANVTPFIGRATLTVYVNKAAVAGTLSAKALLGTWSESGVNFNNLPGQASTSFDVAVSTSAQFVQIDITPIVQGWLNNNNDSGSSSYVGGGNFGIALSSSDGGVFVLDSKEATTTSHAAQLDVDLSSDFTGVLKKDLTLASPGFTSLMSIELSGTDTAGGSIEYMIRATDGGSQIATERGIIQFAATANSITCSVQTADKLHLGTVNSGCTPGFFNPGSHPGISIFDNVSFSSPAPIAVHEVYYKIHNLSGSVVRLEP